MTVNFRLPDPLRVEVVCDRHCNPVVDDWYRHK